MPSPPYTPRTQSSWDTVQASATQLLASVTTTLNQARFARRASYAIHGFLVGIHIALLGICLAHLEERIMLPISTTRAWSDLTNTAITVSGTVFATVYGALLIWITQRLALRRLLTSEQTLTAMHDEFNSWIGLGSAVFALLNQHKIRSSPVSVTLITSYLIGAAILHVSIPAMFTLQVGSQQYTSAELRQAVYPDVWAMLHSRALTMDAQGLFSDASSMLPYVARQSQKSGGSQAFNLVDATMYDQLLSAEVNSTISVNATSFNVSCGALEDLKIENDITDGNGLVLWHNASHLFPNGTTQGNVRLFTISPNNTMALGFPVGIFAEEYVPATNRSFYLYGTFDIADSTGKLLPNTTLPGQQDTSSNISIIGCDLYSYNHTIDFDTSKRMVNYTQVPRLRDHSELAAWQSQGPTAPEDLNILDLWSTAVQYQFTTSYHLGGATEDKLGFMEKYLLSYLGLELPGWLNKTASRGRVFLHDVENALSTLAAATFWALNEQGEEFGIQRQYTTDVDVHYSVQRLHLNLTPVTIGLVVSFFLMLLNALLVRPRISRTVGAVDVLDTLGVLQILWFVRGHPEVLRIIGRVENPNEDELRTAGMVPLRPDIRASWGAPSRGALLTLTPASDPNSPAYDWRGQDMQPSPISSDFDEWDHSKLEQPSH
ncbi:hypothetical protein EV121DRAFT_294015 [Schizophyllum commune]